jgi:probable HAF family extracellular repeat protein
MIDAPKGEEFAVDSRNHMDTRMKVRAARRLNWLCGVAALLAGRAVACAGVAPEFINLGDLPGGLFGARALGLSADGQVAVGVSASSLGIEAFRWTEGGGMSGLGLISGFPETYATAASADGAVIVGYAQSPGGPSQAFRWTMQTGLDGLGDLGEEELASKSFGVSADGSVVVGIGRPSGGKNEAFRWTSATGMQGLGDLPQGILNSAALAISADASVIVGFGSSGIGVNEAAVWFGDDPPLGLGFLPDALLDGSELFAVSGDGTVGAGYSWAAFGVVAVRWTLAEGLESLGDLPGGDALTFAQAQGASHDGSVIVGFGSTILGTEAFFWTESGGMRNLREMLVDDFGLDLGSWNLTSATAVSGDGITIVGFGNQGGGPDQAWLVRLPRGGLPCPTDLTGDLLVGPADLAELLAAWGQCLGCPPARCPADVTGDCAIGADDLAELLATWGPCGKPR